jgi:hypothetical protein
MAEGHGKGRAEHDETPLRQDPIRMRYDATHKNRAHQPSWIQSMVNDHLNLLIQNCLMYGLYGSKINVELINREGTG